MARRMESDIPADALSSIQKGTLGYTYKGVPCMKNPFDLCLYLKLVYDAQPRTVIEIGSAAGGSALWFADTLRNYGIAGQVTSVDLNRVSDLNDDSISFLAGDAMQLGETLTEELLASLPRPWLVIEDAAHTLEVSTAVLEFFKGHLRSGEYIVIEDGIVNDLSGDQYKTYANGPNRAIMAFLSANTDFSIDESYCDYYGHNFTWCTNGYLRRA